MPQDLNRSLELLVEHRYLELVQPSAEERRGPGRRPTECFRVNPAWDHLRARTIRTITFRGQLIGLFGFFGEPGGKGETEGTSMDFIPDRTLFKAVMFARRMMREGTAPAIANSRAANYYHCDVADVAHYTGQVAGRCSRRYRRRGAAARPPGND